jgi:hypothetical protein
MLSLKNVNTCPSTVTVNLLPCMIHYNGPANAKKKYWTVDSSSSSLERNKVGNEEVTKVAYFRGRKLVGATMGLPKGYCGTFSIFQLSYI